MKTSFSSSYRRYTPASVAPGSAQTNALEERPYVPSASVVKGTVAALSDPSEEVVALAVRALADWRQASVAADIAKLLAPATPKAVRMEAFQFFARLGPQAKPHVVEVLKYAKDPDPNIRAAVLAVVFAAQASAENTDAIRPLLNDSRSEVRAAAAKCLGQAGKAAERIARLCSMRLRPRAARSSRPRHSTRSRRSAD